VPVPARTICRQPGDDLSGGGQLIPWLQHAQPQRPAHLLDEL
jgi:hypothetical protein